MSSFEPPADYHCIRVVGSFEELATSDFGDGVNAFCWPRVLPGDFAEVAAKLGGCEGVSGLDEQRLRGLALSDAGRAAVDVLLKDYEQLRERGLDPVLNCITAYPRDDEPGLLPTDVYSFHVDSAPVAAETWLCTYHGACSEGLRNDEAMRRVDIPETRVQLLRMHGGKDDQEFLEFLAENCFDLHYAPAPGAQPFSFGLGNLWRIAIQHPGCPVPPCIHRAPANLPGDPPRLLLIS